MAESLLQPIKASVRSDFSSFHFHNENLNVIVTSLLTALALANIGSIVFKYISYTPKDTFNYPAWLRAYIFTNSDDPARIVSWMMHFYPYTSQNWAHAPHSLQLSRLVRPVLARIVLLLATVASVAISMPLEERHPGCHLGDSKPVWDLTLLDRVPTQREVYLDLSSCLDIPFLSATGTIKSTASFCYWHEERPYQRPAGVTTIDVRRTDDVAQIVTEIRNNGTTSAMHLRLAWKDPGLQNVIFYSYVHGMHLQDQLSVARRAMQDMNDMCKEVWSKPYENGISADFSCNVKAEEMSMQIAKYQMIALNWVRTAEIQKRLTWVVTNPEDGAQKPSISTECPYSVTIQIPVVGILPLLVTVFISFALNLATSEYRMRHGDIFDALFHLVKEVLGHDCTSNAVEENRNGEKVTQMGFRKWLCGASGKAHVGFLGRCGDEEVDDFDSDTVVGKCMFAPTWELVEGGTAGRVDH